MLTTAVGAGHRLHVLAGSRPAPFLVSFDVSRAFDCVDATRLLDLAEPLLRRHDYLLVKYVEVCAAAGEALKAVDAGC